jgi:hypothetical protein
MPGPKAHASAKKTKVPVVRQKEVIYPILLECAGLTRDEFWVAFYQDLAIGKASKGLYISHGVIQSSNKRNGFQYSISDKAPEVIVAELHHLITTHTSICSSKDSSKKRAFVAELEEELSAYERGKWTAIKRKNLRIMLLIDYALHLRKTYDLDWPATIGAFRTITGAFEGKTHTSRDVEYEQGRITSIEDIELSEDGTCIVNIRGDVEPVRIREVVEKNGPGLLQSLWEPYLGAWLKALR